jgi:hypothetical protein
MRRIGNFIGLPFGRFVLDGFVEARTGHNIQITHPFLLRLRPPDDKVLGCEKTAPMLQDDFLGIPKRLARQQYFWIH